MLVLFTQARGAGAALMRWGMAGAFISYAREDEPFARRLYEALTSSGREPTWDRDHAAVPFSSPWRPEIRSAIENSDKFIFVISPDSLASQPCASELAQALEAGKQLIPILRRAPREGQAVAEAIEELNWISFSDDADFGRSLGQLTAALDTDLAWTKSHTRLTVRSAEWARADRDRSLLLRGSNLRLAETWLADAASHPQTRLTEQQRQYIAASRRAADRSARLWRGALAAGLVIALALASAAFIQRNQARREARIAVSGQLAAESEALDASDPVTASQLAAAAWRIAPTAQARVSMLDLLAQPARAVLTPSSGSVDQVAFSPDGKILAIASVPGVVQLWNMATHRQMGGPLTVGDNLGTSVAFSPDSKTVVTGSGNGLARLWDVATRHEIGAPFSARTGEVGPVAFSPDGKIIATASGGRVRLWDAATLDQIGAPMTAGTGFNGRVSAIAFRSGGNTLATAAGGTVQLWDVVTQRRVGVTLTVGRRCSFTCALAFSPGGTTVAAASGDKVSLWSMATHRLIGAPMTVGTGPSGYVEALAFSPNGKTIATGSDDGRARLWAVASESQLGLPLTVATTPLDIGQAMSFSPDGHTLVTGTHDGLVWLWDADIYRQLGAPTPVGLVSGVAVSPNGTILATASDNVRLWDLVTQKWIGAPLGNNSPLGWVAVAFSPDGNTLTAVSANGLVRSWKVTTRQPAGPPMTTANDLNTAAFSPDGKTFATASLTEPLRLWGIATHRQLGAPIATRGYQVSEMAFSPDGRILATEGDRGPVQLWNVATHNKLGAPIVTSAPAGPLAFSPHGMTLATVSNAGGVLLWDVATHRQLGVPLITGAAPVFSMAFSPDGTILATASTDGLVRLWDIATYSQLGAPLTSSTVGAPPTPSTFSNAQTLVVFSPNSKTLVTAGGSVRLWDVAFSRHLLSAMCAIAGRSLTRQEWSTYVPSQPFQQACP
jgi:WD40 repeat protein